MGNVNSGVVRNGDWEHQICWSNQTDQTKSSNNIVRKNSESSSVLSDEHHSSSFDGGRDTPTLLTRGEDSSSGRGGGGNGGLRGDAVRRSLRQAKSVLKDKTEAAASTCATSPPYKRQVSEGSVCYGAELNHCHAVTSSKTVKSAVASDEVELAVMAESASIRTLSTNPGGGSSRELTPIHI